MGSPAGRRELECGKVETGCHGAAGQAPFPEALRRLPAIGRHDRLRALARCEIGSERDALDRALRSCSDLEHERGTGMVVPDLDGIDLVPMRALAAREQEIDRGRCRSAIVQRSSIPEGLAKMSAFGMRQQFQQTDHFGC